MRRYFAAVSRVRGILSSNNEVWPAPDSWQEKEGRNTVEENAFVTRERRILESRDCERTRVKQGPFDTPLQSRLSRTCRHPIYIYTHLPVSMGPEDVVEFRVEQGWECIYRSESSGERWIYPDTEIFASMLSTITHRTSSTEGRAIFQATAGYVYRVTYMRLHKDWGCHRRANAKRKPVLCLYLTWLLACVQTRHRCFEFLWNLSRACFINDLYKLNTQANVETWFVVWKWTFTPSLITFYCL